MENEKWQKQLTEQKFTKNNLLNLLDIFKNTTSSQNTSIFKEIEFSIKKSEENIQLINIVLDNIKFNKNNPNNLMYINIINNNNVTIKETLNKIKNIISPDMSKLKENTLLISYTKQKVVLPFKIFELKEIFNLNKGLYSSLNDVIDKIYTIPISYYKNTAKARFSETFNLVKYKSNCSILKALDYSLETTFKTDLHPAIITACKNIDELDVYLALLNNNETKNFKCFDIVFDCLPVLKVIKDK